MRGKKYIPLIIKELKKTSPEKIILFGSYAYGKPDEESDIDILLDRENHYTDVISVDIQQAIEKSMKAIYALHGEKIPRTHSLDILFNYVSGYIDWKDVEIKDLIMVHFSTRIKTVIFVLIIH